MMEEDYCIYVKCSNNSFIILSLYVDDILIARNNKEMIKTTKRGLSSNFEMKDMSEANYVLSVKIIRDRTKRFLGLIKETYIKKILERYYMQDNKLIDTHVDKSLSPSCDMCPKTLEENEKISKVPYASVVGSLMYTMMCTCPNICYAIGLVS
jgi:ATP-binding cassette subfamily B (MDR/TAP) protein 1